eukprot:11545778-Heterocapsa_arctica.AAC.1
MAYNDSESQDSTICNTYIGLLGCASDGNVDVRAMLDLDEIWGIRLEQLTIGSRICSYGTTEDGSFTICMKGLAATTAKLISRPTDVAFGCT